MNDSQLKKSKVKRSRKKLAYKIFFAFIFANLVLLLYVLIRIDVNLNSHPKAITLKTLSFTPIPPAAYPKLINISPPDISAQAAIIMDSDSKTILYYKNQNQTFPMASSTKIMTALVSLSHYNLNDILVDETYPVEGSIAGLTLGEKMTFRNALYGLLLPSGNDVAVMLAQNYPGGMDSFISQMNQTAASLHMDNTTYIDVDGLSEQNTSSVYDLAILASKAMSNPVFRQVVGTKNITITDVTGSEKHSLTNLNKLLGEDGVNGIKTGFTDEAEGVLVTSKVEKGHNFIIVVLKSQDRFLDTEKLINLINNNV